ncbi:MAG: hypothetical protein ACK4NY_16990 [Spirosomataceae bacterium]
MKKLILSSALSFGVLFGALASTSNVKSVSAADCTMTIKNNKTGDSYTITVHGMSCADLIKTVVK